MKAVVAAPKRTRFGIPVLVTTAALTLLAATACGASSSASTGSNAVGGPGANIPVLEVNTAAAQLLPESVKSTGVLRVAMPTNEPPTQYYREGTQEMTGINADVARLVGQALGVRVEIYVAQF